MKNNYDGEPVEYKLEHNHAPDLAEVMNCQQISNKVKKAVDNPNERSQKLIRQELELYSLQILVYLRKNMHYARQQVYSPLPKSFHKLYQVLTRAQCVTKLGENFL